MKEQIKSFSINSENKYSIPKLKGKAKIELFENGEKVKEVIENNLVTNGIEAFLNPPIDILAKKYYSGQKSGYLHQLLPLYNHFFSSIILINEKLDEDPDNYSPSWNTIKNNITGYAYSNTTDTYPAKGNLNTAESGRLENGYKYVWDFGTDRANGTIQTICLAPPRFGGKMGENLMNGSSYRLFYDFNIVKDINEVSMVGSTSNDYGETLFYLNEVNRDYHFILYLSDGLVGVNINNGNIVKISLIDTENIKLFDAINDSSSDAWNTQIIWTNPNPIPCQFTYFNGVIYIWSKKVIDNSTTLIKVPISSSGIIDEENIEFLSISFSTDENQYLTIVSTNAYTHLYDPEVNVFYLWMNDSRNSSYPYCLYGFKFNTESNIYILSEDLRISNGQWGSSLLTSKTTLFTINGRKYCTMYDTNYSYGIIENFNENNELESIQTIQLSYGTSFIREYCINISLYSKDLSPYLMYSTFRDSYGDGAIGLTRTIPLYSTINVLSTPITKTDTQTMKITYEITQAE
jgi:hypothetical protein